MLEKFKKVGPGLLFAGAAIGVSHIVQSTRAGASYGLQYIWIIGLVHLVKYPFYEISPRYSGSTGESLIQGYHRLGIGYVWLFIVSTILTMFTVQAAVTLVTGSLLSNLIPDLNPISASIVILSISVFLLFIGNYSFLDRFIKLIVILLTISTILAVIGLFSSTGLPEKEAPTLFSSTGFWFLIAFMGWMPATIDIGVWHSVWFLEKKKTEQLTYNDAMFDFKLGYYLCAILAVFFLALGTLTMFASNEAFSPKATVFAKQFISMYTTAIGGWAEPIIQIAALSAMVSTTVTVLDGYPRSLAVAIEDIEGFKGRGSQKMYKLIVVGLALGSVLIFIYFMNHLTLLVDIATIVSFIATPILCWLNYKVIRLENVPEHARFSTKMHHLAKIGLGFFILFALLFLYLKFF